MEIIRIGRGRSSEDRILERDTRWFTLEEKEDAIDYALKTNKKIYISKNKSAYHQITLEELQNL